jgi:uncharacterized membrane protein YvlD (DUF360 family)
MTAAEYGQQAGVEAERPRFRVGRFLLIWLITALGVGFVAWVLPGISVSNAGAAIAAAAVIGVLNAFLPPVVSALRLPFTAVSMLLLMLVVNGLILYAADVLPNFTVDNLGIAIVGGLLLAAVTTILTVIAGVNDDDSFYYAVVRRLAKRSGEQVTTDRPGILFLEIDGLAAPILRRAMRDGHVPQLARWVANGTHRLVEWETDWSSQTGASQAGILMGSNENIPAFRWVEKEAGRVVATSNTDDAAEIERVHSNGDGLLANGGASRSNILSGDATHALLTSSRIAAEKKANPGYRAFYANSFNATRALALFFWEVILELTAAARERRRHVQPHGHRGGIYPLLRGAVCVIVRDLTVYSVISDVFTGRPAVYATFASYDEVAHHSGIERADTLEALRKLDEAFGRIERARRYAPRPYEIVVLSDHGQTQGATFKQRYGETLEDLVRGSLGHGRVAGVAGEDENRSVVGTAFDEATGQGEKSGQKREKKPSVLDSEAVVLASGNLGLVYLMREKHRLTHEEVNEAYPDLIRTLREHPGIGVLLVRSAEHGPLAIGPHGVRYLAEDRVEGDDPLVPFGPGVAQHLLRTDAFAHVADIMVNSFYDQDTDEGCAFEELIGFHGGLGGEQTRPFILAPVNLPLPDQRIVGAEEVHRILKGWRRLLQEPEPGAAGEDGVPAAAAEPATGKP